jgi:hypothetical protein
MIGKALSVLSVLSAAVAAIPAGAAWYVSKTGSNAPPYDSPADAADDIQDALNEAAPYGGFVWVGEGVYPGNIVVPERIYLIGEGPARSTIVGVQTDDSGQPVVALTHEDYLFDFSVVANGAGVGIDCRDGLCHVSDCEVTGALWVGVAAESSWVHVSRCSVSRCGAAGVRCGTFSALTVTDSVIHANPAGVRCDGYQLLMAHCTVVDNFWTGVDNLNAGPCYIRDSIIYRNGGDLSEVPAWSLVNCVVGDPDVAGVNGNISIDPLFLGWGEFNETDDPIFVDAVYTGLEEGTRASPFRTIRAALDVYDYRLAVGSPCVGAASDGRNIGAFPDETPVGGPRSQSVLIRVAGGVYREGHLAVLPGAHLKGPGPGLATISPPRFYQALMMWGNSTVDGFSVVVAGASGIHCAFGAPTIVNCLISSAELSPSSGPEAGVVGGRPLVIDCIIHGMGHPVSASAAMINCTLSANLSEPTVFPPDCGATVMNSIVWGNAAEALGLPPGDVTSSLVSDQALAGLNGNIMGDPRFLNTVGGDFRLSASSPCIDVGFNGPLLPDADIAGMRRIMYGGKSLTVDMGAYEFYINDLTPGPNPDQTLFTWSSLAEKTYSIFYTDDLLTWHLAVSAFPSSGNYTTSWLDDGSLTGLPPLLAPRRFYRILQNP